MSVRDAAGSAQVQVPLTTVAWCYVVGVSAVVAIFLIAILFIRTFGLWTYEETSDALAFLGQQDFFIFVGVGFIAQMVDGALGMAYGVVSNSFLLGVGISPAIASAGVHVSEVFTTAASGISHWRFGNVDRRLFLRLAVPGAIGAAIGAYLLSSVDASVMRPVVAVYLLVMGGVILRKAVIGALAVKQETQHVGWLALFGGFADASGGGGWGPIVTSTLIGSGSQPKKTIGTVNASEFLVALTAAGTFTFMLGSGNLAIVMGLIVGGVLAAPLGAYVCHRINVRAAMGVVGLLVILLSARTILKALDVWPFF
jgi:uncharacterized protein